MKIKSYIKKLSYIISVLIISFNTHARDIDTQTHINNICVRANDYINVKSSECSLYSSEHYIKVITDNDIIESYIIDVLVKTNDDDYIVQVYTNNYGDVKCIRHHKINTNQLLKVSK